MAGRNGCGAMMVVLMLASTSIMAQPQREVSEQGRSGMVEPAIEEAARQIAAQAGDHRLIVLGELHGTREIPALASLLLKHYAAQGPVMLALEMPHSEQPALDRYLASDGGKEAWQALAATPFWLVSDDQHDGRRSVQMRQLIEQVRALRHQGAAVDVWAYDVGKDEADAHDHHWRDQQMAAHLRAAVTGYPGTVLVLTGNVHAMRARPDWAPPELQLAPMTSQLLDLEPFAVNHTGATGHFWGCLLSARCQAIEARSWSGERDLRLDRDQRRSYDLWVRLPRLTVADLMTGD